MKTRNKTITLSLAAVVSCAFSLLLTHPSFADMGAPYVFPQKVIVSRENGITAHYTEYDQGKTEEKEIWIPQGTILTKTYSYTDNTTKKEMMDTKYENHPLTIELDDVSYVDNEFNIDSLKDSADYSYITTPLTKYIINDEVYLYKGPETKYGKVDDEYHLPAGIIVTSNLHDGMWMYVEYDNHSGWIMYNQLFSDNAGTANIATGEPILTVKENIELKDTPDSNGKVIASFKAPQLTEIPTLYYFNASRFTVWYYVSYGQYSGWYYLDRENEYIDAHRPDGDSRSIVIRETNLTEKVESDKPIASVSPNTEVEIVYVATKGVYEKAESKYYINYGNVSGWVNAGDIATETYNNGRLGNKTLEFAQPIYETVDGAETPNVAEAGSYDVLCSYIAKDGPTTDDRVIWYLLVKNTSNNAGDYRYGQYEKIGWIKSMSEEEIEAKKEQEEKELEEQMKKNRVLEEEDLEEYIKNHYSEPEPEKPEEFENFIVWMIVGFGVLSVSIIIALILAKKHKKNKENASDGGGDDSEKSEEKAEENKPNSNEDDAENESKIEEASDENESNSEENSGENEQNFDEDNAENEPESEKEAEENDPDSERDESETDQDFDDIPGDIEENREENGNENSEEEEKSSEENESYFEKELKKIEEESEKKSDEIDQNFAKMEDEIEPNTTKIEDEIEPGIVETEDEIEPNSKKEQKKSSKKSAKKQMKEGGEDE